MPKMNFTAKHLYIATKNPRKYKSIARTINLLDEGIILYGLFDMEIPGCKEIGTNSHENSIIKARYYFNFLRENTLSEDDSIFFDNLPHQYRLKHLAKRRTRHKISGNEYWLDFIEKHNVNFGILEKHFCLVNKAGEIYCSKTKIPFSIRSSKLTNEDVNLLNNFIIPKSFSLTLSEMNNEEIILFSKKYLLADLESLLARLV